jgi:amino acid transporter
MSNVPVGARVCRGCQAEIDYGTPLYAVGILAVLTLIAGLFVIRFVHNALAITNTTFLWIVFCTTVVAGAVLSVKVCKRRYKNKSRFKRIYKT